MLDLLLSPLTADQEKFHKKNTTRHNNGIALYNMSHGVDGDVLGGSTGVKNPAALKYLYEVVLAICSDTTSEMDW